MKKTGHIITILNTVLLVVLCAGLVWIAFRLSSLSGNLEERTDSMAEGVSENSRVLDQLRSQFIEISSDLNEARGMLMLPERTYRLSSGGSEEEEETNLEFFRGIDTIIEKDRMNAALVSFSRFVESGSFTELLSGLSLERVEQSPSHFYLNRDGRRYFSIRAEGPESILVTSFDGSELTVDDYSDELAGFMERESRKASNHYRELEHLTDEIGSLVSSPGLEALFAEKKMSWEFPEETEDEIGGYVTAEDGRTVFRFSIEKSSNSIFIAGTPVESTASFLRMFTDVLESADARTAEQILIDGALERVQSLRNDGGFSSYLASLGLVLAETPREDNDYYYFDITGGEGGRIGSFAVQKMLGEIYLMDEDDVPISSLKARSLPIDSDEKKN